MGKHLRHQRRLMRVDVKREMGSMCFRGSRRNDDKPVFARSPSSFFPGQVCEQNIVHCV
jgi:hypothetical protein